MPSSHCEFIFTKFHCDSIPGCLPLFITVFISSLFVAKRMIYFTFFPLCCRSFAVFKIRSSRLRLTSNTTRHTKYNCNSFFWYFSHEILAYCINIYFAISQDVSNIYVNHKYLGYLSFQLHGIISYKFMPPSHSISKNFF